MKLGKNKFFLLIFTLLFCYSLSYAEEKIISARKVISFKPSKDFKNFVNNKKNV